MTSKEGTFMINGPSEWEDNSPVMITSGNPWRTLTLLSCTLIASMVLAGISYLVFVG